MDSTGAPPPARRAGPALTLQPNQALKLAKAQPGGEWLVLDDTTSTDGVLSARVSSFSFFVPVTVTYLLPIAQSAPLQVTAFNVTCGDQPCDQLIDSPQTASYAVGTNSGQLPANCSAGDLAVQGTGTAFSTFALPPVVIPLSGGSGPTPALTRPAAYRFVVGLRCGTFATVMASSGSIRFRTQPSYPGLEVLRAPAQLDVVAGSSARLDVVLGGGASGLRGTGSNQYRPPTATDRAVVDWQRSDDAGASWRPIARSYEDEADPNPVGPNVPWQYWSVRHGFVAAAADQGALLRVHACYTPPDVAAPPCVSGPATRLNVLQQSALPTIVDVPRSVLVKTGQTASFSATAGGAPAPGLQWQTRPANSSGAWVDASGAGAATGSFSTAALSTADNGTQYRVVASNALGSAESAAVTVSVSDLDVAPAITTQPAALSVAAGSDAAFAIAARGTEALSYQWRKDGVAIVGANSPVLRLAAVGATQAGAYGVTVSNAAGSVTSSPATLTVSAGAPAATPPVIVTQPVSVLVNAGNTATFAVGAGGSGTLAYQWLKNGQPIAGATAAFHSIAATAIGDAGTYAVEVSNGVGPAATSDNAVLTVNAGAQVAPVALQTQPSPQVQAPGGSATFAVAATGSGPIGYQWSKNGAPIAGATGPVLVLVNVTGGDAASYGVTVSNPLSTISSDSAALVVLGAPVIGSPPAAASAMEGQTATFSVAASGSALRYQWTRNAVAIAGAAGASYTTPALALADSGALYGVIVYNGAGVAIGAGAVLTVTPPAGPGPLLATAMAAGYANSLVVASDGTVWAWGYRVDPVTGGYKLDSPWATRPVQVQGLSGVKAVALSAEAGDTFYALHIDGTVSAWGRSSAGALGDRTTTTRTLPVKVLQDATTPMDQVCSIAAGASFLLMARETGCSQGRPAVASGPWIVGLLSNTSIGGDSSSPAPLDGAIAKAVPGWPAGETASFIAAPDAANSAGAAFFITGRGDRYVWGANAVNLLGAGTSTVFAGGSAGPVAPPGSFWSGIGRVELGRDFSLALDEQGGLVAVGRNVEGQLGNGSTTSGTSLSNVLTLANVTDFSVGQTSAAAITDGQLWAWGWNGSMPVSTPTRVGTGSGFTKVVVGDIHSLAIGPGGEIYSWGDSSFGALGRSGPAGTPAVVMRP